MRKFPTLLHLTYNEDGDGFFEVHEHGVSDIDAHGQAVAVYKLMTVGHVNINKTFIEKRKTQRGKAER